MGLWVLGSPETVSTKCPWIALRYHGSKQDRNQACALLGSPLRFVGPFWGTESICRAALPQEPAPRGAGTGTHC